MSSFLWVMIGTSVDKISSQISIIFINIIILILLCQEAYNHV